MLKCNLCSPRLSWALDQKCHPWRLILSSLTTNVGTRQVASYLTNKPLYCLIQDLNCQLQNIYSFLEEHLTYINRQTELVLTCLHQQSMFLRVPDVALTRSLQENQAFTPQQRYVTSQQQGVLPQQGGTRDFTLLKTSSSGQSLIAQTSSWCRNWKKIW